MKLTDIYKHDIVPEDRKQSKVLGKLPKMKRKYLPFTDAFGKLIDVTGGPAIKNPAGGKVVKQTNTMVKTK